MAGEQLGLAVPGESRWNAESECDAVQILRAGSPDEASTANVQFDLEKPHPPSDYTYWATGSATYTISGGKDCTETGTSTFPITGDDGVLGITRHGARWKYEVDIVLRSASPFIVHQTCPDASGDTDTYRSPVLYAGFKSRDVPPGLGSLVGAYGQGTPEEWSWSFSGTPVKKKHHKHHHRH